MSGIWQRVLCVAVVLGGASLSAAEKKPICAVFSLGGGFTEQPQSEDPIFGMLTGESLRSLIARLDKAAADESVKGVVLLIGHGHLGHGQMEEFRAAIERVKAAGKPVFAHADDLHTGGYALLANVSRLSMSPTGDLLINGFYGEQMYLRGLFDKLGIKPDFLTCGSYKSAAETFTRTGPSPEAAEMQKWLYDGLFDETVKLIASGRKVETEKVLKWIDQGMYTSEAAQRDGLINAVEHRDVFVTAIKEQLGSIKFDRSYGKPKTPEIDFNNPFAAMQLWMQLLNGPTVKKSNKDAIAIVHVDGPIMLGKPESTPLGALTGTEQAAYSDPIRKALEEALKDDKVKAVVLRVSSPGGSATASEIILRATQRVREHKPLIISMGDVAASGGYYVACGTDQIFADPATITGSIGVVSGKLATGSVWDKLGIHMEPIQRGKRAGMLSTSRPFTEDERKEMQNFMDEIYGVFKKHVTDARGNKLKKPIEDLAGGRVYTGRQALELGLVDQLGGLNDAILAAATAAHLADYEIRTLPQAANPLESLLGGTKKEDDTTLSEPSTPIRPQFRFAPGADLDWRTTLGPLQQLDPERIQLLSQALRHLQTMSQEHVLLSAPLLDLRVKF